MAPLHDEAANDFLQRLRSSLSSLGPAEAPADNPLPFVGGLIGYLGYDFGRRLEQLPAKAVDDLHLSDARFGLYAWALLSDHQRQRTQLVFHPGLASAERERLLDLFSVEADSAEEPFHLLGPFQADIDQHAYRQAFERIQAYIQAGDCYQVNFAQRFRARYQGSPWTAYQALRAACPTPFSGYLSLPEQGAIISLSPERFMRISQGQVETRPIKGTRPRDSDPSLDAAQAAALLDSLKDRAENLMIVDLLRNDLGRSCRIGSVRVPELFALESYPNVHHLVSAVTGELAADKDALDLIAGSFPGGSITGAPKIRAMQIIDELEKSKRGPYAGCVGYFSAAGQMDSCIVLRTALVKDGVMHVQAGAGLVHDSVPEKEQQECINKAQALFRAAEEAVRFATRAK